MRWIDIPPSWLIAALCVAWGVGQVAPLDLGPVARGLGTGLVWLALGVIVAAGWEFARARTSIIPRRAPKALITSGIFRLTRNPIYVADALILAGLSLRWDAGAALVLVPVFIWWITRRFIEQEERTLAEAFPLDTKAYYNQTRRWL